jgi:hypothetical protein
VCEFSAVLFSYLVFTWASNIFRLVRAREASLKQDPAPPRRRSATFRKCHCSVDQSARRLKDKTGSIPRGCMRGSWMLVEAWGSKKVLEGAL